MRILALYLPQFHQTPENDDWWGKGYTEWTAVKAAKPMYKGHMQPKKPFNDNYYDLSDESGQVWNWQADLARNHGVYGFCIYHYWLGNGRQLLQKPMEILLRHPQININYCVCWANHDWTRAWYGEPTNILCKQEYGLEEEWTRHYKYLSKFFYDKRYIKKDNRPIVCIYDSKSILKLKEMKKIWERLAIEDGFAGIYLISANTATGIDEANSDSLDAYYNFEAGYTYYQKVPFRYRWMDFQLRKIRMRLAEIKGNSTCGYRVNAKRVYKYILKNQSEVNGKKIYQGIFSNWDNTPRRGCNGMVYEGCTPELFGRTLKKLKEKVGKEEFVFLDAWNEWGEGCYVEPDVHNGLGYLEQIKVVQGSRD